MIRQNIAIDRKTCEDLAERIFLKSSGLDREGNKFDRMRKDAYRMRDELDGNIEIKGAYIYLEADEMKLEGRDLVIGNQKLNCPVFEQISPETVKGVFVYAVTAGTYEFPDEVILNQLFADIWGSAFADAIRLLMARALGREHRLSDSFGPGFYGMDVAEMTKLSEIMDFTSLGMEVRNSCIILPLKSCAGILFDVTDGYEPMPTACQSCMGTQRSCQLCHVQESVR